MMMASRERPPGQSALKERPPVDLAFVFRRPPGVTVRTPSLASGLSERKSRPEIVVKVKVEKLHCSWLFTCVLRSGLFIGFGGCASLWFVKGL